MIIKSLTIENFKGINKPVIIDFKPITLLFGANSSGKSTLIQAIQYAREIFDRENVDADNTVAGGDAIDLGGFKSFVYGHDLSKTISIRFDLDLTDIDLSDYLSGTETDSGNDIPDWENRVLGTVSRVNSAWVKISVKWNKWQNRPLVESYEVGLNGGIFAKIEADTDYHQFELSIFKNKVFPYAQMFTDHFEMFENYLIPEPGEFNEGIEITMEDFNKSVDVYIPQDDLSEDWSADIDDKESDYFTDDIKPPDLYMEDEYSDIDASEGKPSKGDYDSELFERLPSKIGLPINQKSVLPEWDKTIVIQDPFWKTDYYSTNQFYNHIISTLLKGPGVIVKELLNQFRYLGPLRVVPPRYYSPMLSKNESRWASGLAAWDVLHFSDQDFIEKTNSWIAGEDKLNTGYKIELKQYKEIDISNPLVVAISQGRFIDEDRPQEAMDEFPTKSRLNLREKNTDIEVYPQDIGMGISQVIPVVVAALHKKRGIVAIEQPELHIHPAFQVALGDLFVSQIQDKDLYFLLETHSEHLMLRLLRRIRETGENDLEPGKWPLRPDQLAIHYLEKSPEGIQISRIRIDEEGEFIDRWPKGFFSERAEELF
jgi:hypothetical protein